MSTESLASLNYLLIILAMNSIGFLYFYFSPARKTVELRSSVNAFMTFFALVAVAFIIFASRTLVPVALSLTLANAIFLCSAYAAKNGFMYRTGAPTRPIRYNKKVWLHVALLTVLNTGVFYYYLDNFAIRATITQLSVAWVFYTCIGSVAKDKTQLSEGEKIAKAALYVTVFFIVFSTVLHWFDQSFFTYMSSLMFTQSIAVTALMGAFLTLMMSDLIDGHYRKSVIDPLTGVYNRRFFIEQAPKVVGSKDSSKANHSVIMVDIDNFKAFNDTHGHAIGDKILTNFAKVLSGQIRDSDVIARFGGEEFVVLLPGSTIDVARKLAERLCASVANTPVEVDNKQYHVTASFGVASLEGPSDLTRGLELADQAMYRAKQKGKNTVVVQ